MISVIFLKNIELCKSEESPDAIFNDLVTVLVCSSLWIRLGQVNSVCILKQSSLQIMHKKCDASNRKRIYKKQNGRETAKNTGIQTIVA